MKPSVVLTLLLALALVSPAAAQEVNQDYVHALTTADRFLNAWRLREVPEALHLVAPAVRHGLDAGALSLYLGGISNPHHQAYEVCGGRQVGPHSYAFPIRFYELVYEEPWRGLRGPALTMVVSRMPSGGWFITHLPGQKYIRPLPPPVLARPGPHARSRAADFPPTPGGSRTGPYAGGGVRARGPRP